MGKTGFEKASEKMFGRFSGGVSIAQPAAEGRMSSEERKRFEESVAAAPASLAESAPVPSQPQSPQDASRVEEEPRGKGRPRKDTTPVNPVFMNFRVEEEFRQKIKEFAVERRVPIVELLHEAFELLFEKYK